MVDLRQEQPTSLSGIMRLYYTQVQYAELRRLLYEKNFPIAQSFINLALVKEEEQIAKELKKEDLKIKKEDQQIKEKEPESKFRDARINSFEDIHKPKEPIQIEYIFDRLQDVKAPQHILIEGRAGIGKTTLCEFITNQRAEEKGKLKAWRDKFKLLIWLPSRELIADANLDFKTLNLAGLIFRDIKKAGQDELLIKLLKS